MCANYTPVNDRERLKAWFAAGNSDPWPDEAWPGYAAPFVRHARDRDAPHAREACVGLFGLVPYWSKDPSIGRRTYNARSETADAKPSFRDAWQRGRRCIVPAENFFEPNWESGKPVRWRIARRDGAPMGIAGLWGAWRAPDGRTLQSFTMLTVNADGHPVMQRFHRPADEKRMVAILEPAEFDAWLDAPPGHMRTFLRRCPADELVAEPAPLPPRPRR